MTVDRPPPDWDARYGAAGAGGLFGDGPNEYLRLMVARSDFDIATALMLADGDGRNGTWLAGRGVAVTAVDISSVATGQAKERDAAQSVEVERIIADLGLWSPPPGRRWDAVIMLYLQAPPEIRLGALDRAAAALSPGGWVVVEAFAKTGAGSPAMGPGHPDLRYSIEELEAVLPGFATIEALTGRVRLEEGTSHRGLAEVVRFAARRPTP